MSTATSDRDPETGKRCDRCGGFIPYPLRRCRRRRCPGYSRIWAGDQRRKTFAGLTAYANQVPRGLKSPHVRMSAVTAPGVCPALKWDERRCAHLGAHRHSVELGCKFEEWPAHQWNRTAPARWRAMHGEACRRCRREGLKPWLLTRVWELQKRGLLHVHPVLAYSTASERRGADRYLEQLDDLRHRYGFGYVERKRLVREPSAAAAYLSAYFVTGKRRKLSLQESVQSPEMPRSIIHLSTRLTQISGVTMRSLRLHRYRWVLRRQIGQYLEYVGDFPDDLLQRLEELDASLTRGP